MKAKPTSREEWHSAITRAEAAVSANSLGVGDPPTAPALNAQALAASIDHTLLKLDATEAQIDQLCDEAKQYNFKSVCVRLRWVSRAVQKLKGTPVLVACVVGFHEGTYPSKDKEAEAASAIRDGAKELDMVINHVLLRQSKYQEVHDDIAAVRGAAPSPAVLKVILETSVLARGDIIAGCTIAQIAGADFVKTSTGFNGEGATTDNVRLMKNVVGDSMKVKASGGVRTRAAVEAMMAVGASRIGTSNGVSIMAEADSRQGATEQAVVSRRESSVGAY